MKRSGLLVLWLSGHVLCGAQDVFVSPAFEHTIFTGDGYVNGIGASLGLRFPISGTRSTVELRPAYVHGTMNIESLDYMREEGRFGGSVGIIRSLLLNENASLDYGVEGGLYHRWIDVYHGRPGAAQQRTATIGGSLTIRASRLSSVQPFLSIHPFYERSMDVEVDEVVGIQTGNQLGLTLCLGLQFGLPSSASGSGWD